MSKVKIQGHASGSGVLTITAPNTSTDRTITLPDTTGTLLDENSSVPAANLTGTVADARISTLTASKLTGALPAISGASLTGMAGSTPAFYVHQNDGDQIAAAHSTTTIMTGNTLHEAYDTDNAFTNSNGRFTPQTAGYYMINVSATGNPDASTQHPFRVDLRKNGSVIARGESREKNSSGSDTMQVALQAIVQFNGSSDYVDFGVWTYAYTGNSTSLKVEWINFSGFLIKAT